MRTQFLLVLTLWAIEQRERKVLSQTGIELSARSEKPMMPRVSLAFFVGFFSLELFFSFLAVLAVFVGYDLQEVMTESSIILAIIGVLPPRKLCLQNKMSVMWSVECALCAKRPERLD
jgi:hypothetical protein